MSKYRTDLNPATFGTAPFDRLKAEAADDAFDEAVQNATMAVMDDFDYLGLPEGDQLSGLMIEVNDAISAIFEEWK